MCIGRSGCVIREMQNQSGTKIQIPSFSTPGLQTRIATVTGPVEGCERVKQMIERIVLEQSSQSVMSGVAGQGHDQYAQSYGGGGQGQPYGHGQNAGAFGGYGGQQQAYGMPQQQSGAQDYSKEWAAYYAAQGAMHGNGGATESYGASATAAVTEAASAVTAQADTYYEQFFRYAYYYGEEAARSHYGAWSPPPGTPNPYGVNPNGITQAPTAAAEQHVAPAPAPVAYSQSATAPAAYSQSATAPAAYSQSTPAVTVPLNVRDSGRRGVSNLPAWMTKG
jgi:far upstream element-binding protein